MVFNEILFSKIENFIFLKFYQILFDFILNLKKKYFENFYFTMNNVHLVTPEKYRVEPGQKLSQVHQNTQPGPAAHTRRAQAAQPAAPRAPACAYRAPPLIQAVSARLLRAPRACCRSPSLQRAPPAARLSAPARLPAPVRLPPCAPQHAQPSAPLRARLSYRGPSGRVVGAGCAPAGPYRRHSALHAQPA